MVKLDALLVPSDDSGPGTNIPAQAGYPIITIVSPGALLLVPLCTADRLNQPIGIDGWRKWLLVHNEGILIHCTSTDILFGLSFVGTAFSEPTLIQLASAAQDALGHRRVSPTFFELDATNIPVNFGLGTY